MRLIRYSDLAIFNEIERYRGISPTLDVIMMPVLLILKVVCLFTFNVFVPLSFSLAFAKIFVALLATFIAILLGLDQNLVIEYLLEISKLTYLESVYM